MLEARSKKDKVAEEKKKQESAATGSKAEGRASNHKSKGNVKGKEDPDASADQIEF